MACRWGYMEKSTTSIAEAPTMSPPNHALALPGFTSYIMRRSGVLGNTWEALGWWHPARPPLLARVEMFPCFINIELPAYSLPPYR